MIGTLISSGPFPALTIGECFLCKTCDSGFVIALVVSPYYHAETAENSGLGDSQMGNTRLFTAGDVLTIIRAEMIQFGMTQAQYAVHIGCTQGELSKVLSKKRPPTGAVLAHLRLQSVGMYAIYQPKAIDDDV